MKTPLRQNQPPLFWKPSTTLLSMFFILSLSFSGSPAFAQDAAFEVSGTVSSADNSETLPGANILIKGTTAGAVSDMN